MTTNNLIMEIGNLPNSQHIYPSPLVAFNLQMAGKPIEVIIPKNELARVKEIFQQNEYSVLNHCSFEGKRTIINVGANVGLFSLYMKMNYPDSKIFAFEPVPSTFELLKLNTLNLADINIFPFALFDEEKIETIQLHVDNSGANTIKVQDQYKSHFESNVEILLKKAGKVLSELNINKIDILKIDTEGCEVEILESLQSFLPETDYVLVQYHSEADQRKIDSLFENFKVFSSNAITINCGQVKYINSKLLDLA